MNNKYYLFLSIILSLYIVSCPSVFGRDLTDYDINDFINASDLPSADYNSSGYCTAGSMVTYYNENPRYDFCFERYTNNGGEDGYIYMCVSSGDYGYQYRYEIYNNANPYAPNAPSFIAYGKSFTVSEIEESENLLEEFEDVVDNPDNVVNRTAHYTFYGDSIITNIPLFNASDTSGINNYVQNGDISSAINQNIINPPPEIPYPTNISLSKTSKQNYGEKYFNPIVVSWDAGSNSNYNYQNMRFSVSYEAVYGYSKAGISNTVSSGVKNVAQHVKYQNENQTYTLGVDNLNENLTLTIAGLQLDIKNKWLNSITIYIQNEDDQNSSFVSSIKYVAYDFVTKIEDSSNTPIDDGSLGGGESDGNSSGVGDGSQGFQSGNSNVVNNNNPSITINNDNKNITGGATDNYITSAIKGALDGTSDFGDTVHNGFGLLGENGFLSAVSAMFAFVPSNIITMFTTTIGACCLMFIVGAVIWFIRG